MEVLIKEKPDVMLNLSASPYNYAADVVRRSIIEAHTLKYGLTMLYCNTVGSQTEIVFYGGSLIYDAGGNLVKEMNYFEEDYYLAELDLSGKRPSIKDTHQSIPGNLNSSFLIKACLTCSKNSLIIASAWALVRITFFLFKVSLILSPSNFFHTIVDFVVLVAIS